MSEVLKQETLPVSAIADRIQVVRGQRVLLDRDLAELYGVEVRAFNQAVKRNSGRFPVDFMFTLTEQEVKSLRSQIVILDVGRGQHSKYLPHAFTEHGAIMAASVLNSPRAIELSVYIVRAFVQMREVLAAQPDLVTRVGYLETTAAAHDSALRGVIQTLGRLNAPAK
jgi:hypothetical protein